MSEPSRTARLEQVFSRVFPGKLAFRADLRREDEPSWDSLKHIELLVALEKEFGVRMDGADATEMTSVPRILEILGSKLGES